MGCVYEHAGTSLTCGGCDVASAARGLQQSGCAAHAVLLIISDGKIVESSLSGFIQALWCVLCLQLASMPCGAVLRPGFIFIRCGVCLFDDVVMRLQNELWLHSSCMCSVLLLQLRHKSKASSLRTAWFICFRSLWHTLLLLLGGLAQLQNCAACVPLTNKWVEKCEVGFARLQQLERWFVSLWRHASCMQGGCQRMRLLAQQQSCLGVADLVHNSRARVVWHYDVGFVYHPTASCTECPCLV
jgi:hypothetical protein